MSVGSIHHWFWSFGYLVKLILFFFCFHQSYLVLELRKDVVIWVN